MSGSERRPPPHLEVRHAGRGEPMPTPRTERDIEDALARHQREMAATHDDEHRSWWRRILAGRVFRDR